MKLLLKCNGQSFRTATEKQIVGFFAEHGVNPYDICWLMHASDNSIATMEVLDGAVVLLIHQICERHAFERHKFIRIEQAARNRQVKTAEHPVYVHGKTTPLPRTEQKQDADDSHWPPAGVKKFQRGKTIL